MPSLDYWKTNGAHRGNKEPEVSDLKSQFHRYTDINNVIFNVIS